MGFKDSLIGALRPNRNLNFAVTEGTPALVGVDVFIDIDAAVHVATLEQDSNKFFVLLRLHASSMTGIAVFR